MDRKWTREAVGGAVAGIASRLVISPFDVVKIRLQLTRTHTSIARLTADIIRNEGLRGLYKGNGSALILYGGYGACQFSMYHGADLKGQPAFVRGAVAGAFATVVTYPFDLLRTRFAVQGPNKLYTGILDAFTTIAKREGIPGFYRGMVPALLQIMPMMGIVFKVHNSCLDTFSKLDLKSAYPMVYKCQELISGGIAGSLSKALLMPLDVIRKRLQVQGPVRNAIIVDHVPRYTGFVKCAFAIVRYEGVRGLYRGLIPAIAKSGPSTAVTFFVVREFQKYSQH